MRRLLIAASAALFLCGNAQAQTYPTRAISIVSAFPAGGVSDTQARMAARIIESSLSQPAIVLNKPGADGTLAPPIVMQAKPDGYTLLFGGPSTMLSGPVLQHLKRSELGYDTSDFVPIAQTGEFPMFIAVSSELGVNSVSELVALARQRPLTHARAQAIGRVGIAQFNKLLGTTIADAPYKGEAPAITDLLGGHVQVVIATSFALGSHVQSGKVRLLATVDELRSPLYPDVPTMKEAGVEGWVPTPKAFFGLYAPAGTPAAVVTRLSEVLLAGLGSPEFVEMAKKNGLHVVKDTPAVLQARLLVERERWEMFFRTFGTGE